MLKINDSSIGVQIYLEGKIKEVPRKLNYNEITSIYGGRFTEFTRGVKDLEISINYINEKDYSFLQDIFLISNTNLEIEDIDVGKTYYSYYISGESLSLDKYEDYDNKSYYYKGGITLYKR